MYIPIVHCDRLIGNDGAV